MTPEEEALASVLTLLDQRGVPYMLTGSVAASYHGRPRATHDSDIVIDPSSDQMAALVQSLLDAGFYVDAARSDLALRSRRSFNAIDGTTGCKVDLIVRRDREFSRKEFDRRTRADLPFRPSVSIVSAEDAVLSKLEWARLGGDSERQLADAAGVVAVNRTLDRVYIERWAAELGVLDLWRRIASS